MFAALRGERCGADVMMVRHNFQLAGIVQNEPVGKHSWSSMVVALGLQQIKLRDDEAKALLPLARTLPQDQIDLLEGWIADEVGVATQTFDLAFAKAVGEMSKDTSLASLKVGLLTLGLVAEKRVLGPRTAISQNPVLLRPGPFFPSGQAEGTQPSPSY